MEVQPMILYKYLSLARKDFWDNFHLRFTQPSSFNDPFDCVPSYSFLPQHLMPENAGFGELASLFWGIEQDTASFNDDYGIFCMSESWDSILMWAHYADSHEGFVVGFDVSHPFFNLNQPYGTRKVKYCSNRPKMNPSNIFDELYYKLSIWNYEREWRLCKELYKADKTIDGSIHLFSFPRESIKYVYFGICMPPDEKMLIYKKASLVGVKCYQVMRDYQTFDLHAIEFSDFLLLSNKYAKFSKEFQAQELPHIIPDNTAPTTLVVANSLKKLSEILNCITNVLWDPDKQSPKGTISIHIKSLVNTLVDYEKDLTAINCLPNCYEQCDISISLDEYQNKVKHIQHYFDLCIYWLSVLIKRLRNASHGILPCTEYFLSTQIQEKLGGSISAFAGALSYSALFLNQNHLTEITMKITFDSNFQKITADLHGWKIGQSIMSNWQKKKQYALKAENECSLKRYRSSRISWVCMQVRNQCTDDSAIVNFIEKECQYYQDTIPTLSTAPPDYQCPLSDCLQKIIKELCFFWDVVHSNGGFLPTSDDFVAENRRKNRIKVKLLNSGIEEKKIEEYMKFFPKNSLLTECDIGI